MTTYDIDPRDVRRMADMHTVYRMFDTEGRLLYIGRTGDAARRFGDHTAKRWFPLVKTIALEWYPTEAATVLAERRAIRSENPRYNKADRKPSARPRRPRCPARTAVPQQKVPLLALAMTSPEDEFRESVMALLKNGTTASKAAQRLGVTKAVMRGRLEALRNEGIARVEGVRKLARWVLVPVAEISDAQ